LKYLYIAFIFLFVFFSCKTVNIKEKEYLKKNVVYKKMISKSESINSATISGSLQISGNKNIPAVYISFSVTADIASKKSILKLSVLSKPLLDLYMNSGEFIIVNHTDNNYVRLNDSVVDFSKILGFNFNPIELVYFLLGLVPYSDDLQMIDFIKNKTEYQLKLTNQTTNFVIIIDDEEKIVSARLQNQFFDPLTIDILSYNTMENGEVIPQRLKVKPDNNNVSMTFVIRSTSIDKVSIDDFTNTSNYFQLDDPEKIIIKIK